jgi:uncharacterized protein (DUF58 family)
MNVTKSFIFLVALGVVVIFITWRFDGAYFVMFGFWNLFLCAMFVCDVAITPGKKFLSVRRSKNSTLYFSSENEIFFYVKNNSRHTLDIEAKDESVRFFSNCDENFDLAKWVLPRTEEEFSYTTTPTKRGSFPFEKIFLRYTGVLGLCVKHAEFSVPIEFKVYPNVRDLSKYRLMLQRKLLLRGDKKIKNYGVGYEFESLRPYAEGDDYRKINWRATSRENKLIVNQFQIERNQPVYILLDISRPMSYSVGGRKKLDFAINAALILSDIVNQSGDKAGLLVFDSRVRSFIAAGQGAAHRNKLMETLYKVEDNRSTADYSGAFRTLCEKQKRRSLVFIFTDFEAPEEARELISDILILKKRHLPIVVFMENENLNALTELEVRKKYDDILKKTAQEFQSERKNIFRYLSAMGIPNVESKAEEFAVAAVNNYIKLFPS